MAINIKYAAKPTSPMDNVQQFFLALDKLTGGSIAARVEALMDLGMKVEFGFNTLILTSPVAGAKTELKLPVSQNQIEKGTAPKVMAGVASKAIETVLHQFESELPSKPNLEKATAKLKKLSEAFADSTQAVQATTPKTLQDHFAELEADKEKQLQKEKDQQSEALAKLMVQTPEKAKKPLPKGDTLTGKSKSTHPAMQNIPKPATITGEVYHAPKGLDALQQRVSLYEAQYINQPVFGSDSTSMYRVIGVGQKLKMAARVKENTLSIRVEGGFTPEAKTTLMELGFKATAASATQKGYMSAHFDVSECPAERVLGAVLYGKGLNLVLRLGAFEEMYDGA